MVAVAALSTISAPDVSWDGVWVRNADESDDPKAKLQAAMGQMREQTGDSEGRRPGGRGGGPGMGGREPGRRGGPGEGLGRVADELTLELREAELHIDDGERLQIYYLDGKEHVRETTSGMKLESKAVLKGYAVLIEESMDRGRIDRKLEMAPDGDTMVVTVTMKMGRMTDPVVIRTVYERS